MEPAFEIAAALDLASLARSRSAEYRAAAPYPHAVFDGFLPATVLRGVVEEFPAPADWPAAWGRRDDEYQRKYGSRGRDLIGPRTLRLIDELNSQPFLDFLGALTGIDGLVADPDLVGAGLHQVARGGYLAIHADFNKAHHRDRRLNLLVYLNEGWSEDWGGQFEMWTADLATRARSVVPAFNRAVVFSTNETSYHGHPRPLRCPPDRTRKSLTLYYYTRGVREDAVSERFRSEYVDTDWKLPQGRIKLM